MLYHVTKFFGLAAPPRGDGRQEQLFTEQMTTQAGQESEEGRAFHQTNSQGVCDCDVAGASRLDQPRYSETGIAAQLERIAKGIVHPAQDDIHRLESLNGLQKDTPVSHSQVCTFDEGK